VAHLICATILMIDLPFRLSLNMVDGVLNRLDQTPKMQISEVIICVKGKRLCGKLGA
jgi:hypothetical protein